MTVNVEIPTVLTNITGGLRSVTATGATLREVLTDLETRHPGIQGKLLQGDGQPEVRQRVRQ